MLNNKLNIKIFLKILSGVVFIIFVFFFFNKDSNYFSNNESLQDLQKTFSKKESKIIDGVKLPPDPGEEGKKTLEGIDSDKDGIRDDVQIAIYERYPSEPEKRKILFQKGKNIQDAVIFGAEGDRNKILKAAGESSKVTACMVEKMKDSYEDLIFLETKIMNIRTRILAQEKYDLALNGTFWRALDCEE